MVTQKYAEPTNQTLIDAVLDGLKHGVIFLVDIEESDAQDVGPLVKKTERLAFDALVKQFGTETARKFFVKSENEWILRTAFGGWLFFYPIEVLTPQTSLEDVGKPDFVYWPDADGRYERVPWIQWLSMRVGGHVWRPKSNAKGPRSVWDRIRDP